MTIEAGAIALWVLKLVGGETFKALAAEHWPKTGTANFLAARDEILRDWIFELAGMMNAFAASLPEGLRQLVDERLQEHEAHALLANYCEDVYSEPLARRRKMILHAAASLADPRMSVPEGARVRRILLELDPDEVITLYRLWLVSHTVPPGPLPSHRSDERHRLWEESGADALLASGCVRSHVRTGLSSQVDELTITRTGKLVLRATRSFVHAQSPDWSSLRRHEVTANFRSEVDARQVLDAVEGLMAIVLDAERFAGWYTPSPSTVPTGKACLRFQAAPAPARAIAKRSPPQKAEFGQPVTTIWAEAGVEVDSVGRIQLSVFGPHDVLRFAAYDIDCMWS